MLGISSSASARSEYTIERSLNELTDEWLTRLEFPPPPVFATTGTFVDSGPRVVIYGDTVPGIRVYDQVGNLLQHSFPDFQAKLGDTLADRIIGPAVDSFPGWRTLHQKVNGSQPMPSDDPTVANLRTVSLSAGPTSAASLTSASPEPEQASRAWVDDEVLWPQRRAARLADLRARLGWSGEKLGAYDRIVVRDPTRGMTYETLVDTLLGAVIEENIADRGRLISQATYHYKARGQGLLVRDRIRIEHEIPSLPGVRQVVETQFYNIKLLRRGAR